MTGPVEAWSIGDGFPADLHRPDPVRRIVVVAHGGDGWRRSRYVTVAARVWGATGTAVVAIDAPGHGERPGVRPTGPLGASPAFADAWIGVHRHLLDAVADRFPALPIGMAGFSMGALFGVALAAGDDRIGALALALSGSTAVSLPHRFPGLDPGSVQATDPAGFAPRVRVPVLMVNTTEDTVVPGDAADALARAFPTPPERLVVPGTHDRWPTAARWYRRMGAFFAETLG